MKFILISDSHGNSRGINKILETQDFDYLFFMGDGLKDLGTAINLDNVYAVSGNCDLFSDVPNERFIEIKGIKVFITHGNRYGVKSNLNNLIERGVELDADFVFYGHNHKQKVEKIGDIYYINPGSFYPNSDKESIGLVVEVTNNEIKAERLIM